MTALRAAAVAGCSVAIVLSGIRWLRVAQREHYLAGSVTRFAWRWWRQDAPSVLSLLGAAAGMGLAWRWPATAVATAVVVAAGPLGLGLRGRTSKLAWTRRLRTLAAVWVVLEGMAVVIGTLAGAGPLVAAAAALAVPFLVDAACAVTAPFEGLLAAGHVRRAAQRLGRVAPTVVAITGSYGKTGTKGYVAHLVGGSRTVVASPASFNNRAGLARAVNENLVDGTEVFVAEMGTYGPGEIAALCSWLVPDVAVITAVGPVHLERFGTEERIVEAKAEILERAGTAVVNVDDPRLAAVAGRSAERGRKLRRVSGSGAEADVVVRDDGDGPTVFVDGAALGAVPAGTQPGNVACAVAVAVEIGVAVAEIAARLPTLPTAPHRLEAATGSSGIVVLDDTYNANPAGARAALAALASLASPSGRRVVVTPGMVELGRRQAQENTSFAAAAAAAAVDDLVVVGRTNRRALLAGAEEVGEGGHPVRCVVVDRRPQAVDWVRQHLGAGDVVLYENDLPDHYP